MSTHEAQNNTITEPPKLTKVQYLKKHWVMVIAFIIVLASILWILKLIFLPSSIIKTDDARVDVEYSTIAPKVSGNIEEIYIKDHQTVKKASFWRVLTHATIKQLWLRLNLIMPKPKPT